MNKQELIYKIEKIPYNLGPIVDTMEINRAGLIKLIEQLDEPQKPVVPQFVADWIEHTKKENYHIFGAIQATESDDMLDDWMWCDDNMELFARAWLDGYEIEKEKWYLVKMKDLETGFNFLNRHKRENYWVFSSNDESITYQVYYTRKELEEAGFGLVFDCPGIEIEVLE